MASATSSLPWLRLPANTSAWLSRRDRVFGLPKTHAVATVTRQSNQQSNSPCYSHSRHDQIQHPHEEETGKTSEVGHLGSDPILSLQVALAVQISEPPSPGNWPEARFGAWAPSLGSGLRQRPAHDERTSRCTWPLGPVTSQQLVRDA